MKQIIFSTFAVVAGLALAPVAAQADGHDKYADTHHGWTWYAEISVGGPIPQDYDNTVGGVPVVYDPDAGFGVAGALGAYLTDNWRADVTLAYATAGDGVLTGGLGTLPHAGDVNVFNVLFNAYYEFGELGNSRITPWVGAGIGFQVFDYDNLGAVGGGFTLQDSDTVFVGALHAGLDFALTESIDLIGRYSLVFVGSHDVVGTTGVPVAADSSIENAFFGGLRFKFNPPY